jgi:hypothetical protein
MPANCVGESLALLRLFTALRGIAGTKFREVEVKLLVGRTPPSQQGHLDQATCPPHQTGLRIWKMNPRSESQPFIISKDARNQEQKVKSQDVFNFTDFDFLFFRFIGGKLCTSQ